MSRNDRDDRGGDGCGRGRNRRRETPCPPTIAELQAQIDKQRGKARWIAAETPVWTRRRQDPKDDGMAGVRLDRDERTLARQLLGAQAVWAKKLAKGVAYDGATVHRRQPARWHEQLAAEWSVGAAGKGGDQGKCKSCVAFALIAAIEARLLAGQPAANSAVDLSEGHLFNCGQGGDCTSGWDVGLAFEFALTYGLADESAYPVAPGAGTCPANLATRQPLKGAALLNPLLPETKATIQADGPVVAVMEVYEDFLALRSNDPYVHVSGEYIGLHAVTVYDHDQESWHCLNSYGPAWGDQGRFRIKFGQCAIDDYFFWAPIV